MNQNKNKKYNNINSNSIEDVIVKIRLTTKMTSLMILFLLSVVIPMGTLAYLGAPRNIVLIIVIGIMILGCIVASIASTKIIGPLASFQDILERLAKGDVSMEIPEVKTKDEFGQLARSFKQMVDIRKQQTEILRELTKGNLNVSVDLRSDEDIFSLALIDLVGTLKQVSDELIQLGTSATNGKSNDTKRDIVEYSGVFKEFMDDINEGFDMLTKFAYLSGNYIVQIGEGKIPEKISEKYPGSYQTIIDYINSGIDGISALKEGNRVLALMRLNDYTQKIEGNYPGIYGEISDSVNAIIESMNALVPIMIAISNGDLSTIIHLRKAGKLSENDEYLPALTQLMESILLLTQETNDMTVAAVAGNLDNRGDVTKFSGEYARVIEGFNNTLDAIIAPMQEASQVLGKLAQGNLDTYMKGDYQGQNAQIMTDMNLTVSSLKRYIGDIARVLEAMSCGNFNQEIRTEYLGDFLTIKNALNEISNSLSDAIKEIDNSAAQVDSGARQISDGGQALAQGTTEQASSIQELSASIEEVAEGTKRNAVNSNKANTLTVQVRENARLGNEQIKKMMTAMTEINTSSNSISKIIKVIDDIAFQTNILALNAAVEAARAGHHGKGFAVVAEEVRTLAARSAEAAKETAALIEGSIEKVTDGTKITEVTAGSIKVILSDVEEVALLVGEIASASNQQASEISQITLGIDQISRVVQTNSATAEESAAASEELSSQAQMLKMMVDQFEYKNV